MSKYEKIETVGEGAYGIVLKCRHRESGDLVAIKKFKEREEDLDEVTRKTVLREVKLLKALKHENIIDMREAYRRKGTLHLVFEFFGQSMLEVLDANASGLEAEAVRSIVCQAARALEYCHWRGVIHRDVKPENLLIDTTDNSVRLCDFGCARKVPEAGVELTDYVATRWYRPPELLLCSTDYGVAVDIWALGCIAGELTDGQPLFAGKSDIDQLCVIQQVLGPMTAEQLKKSMELSGMNGVAFPEVVNPETLEKRYAGRATEPQLRLMQGALALDPAARLTAKAALQMPWLQGVVLPGALKRQKREASRARRPGSKEKRQSASTDAGCDPAAGTALSPPAAAAAPSSADPAVAAALAPMACLGSSRGFGTPRRAAESPAPSPLFGSSGGCAMPMFPPAAAAHGAQPAIAAGALPAIGGAVTGGPRLPLRRGPADADMPSLGLAKNPRTGSRDAASRALRCNEVASSRQGSRSATPDVQGFHASGQTLLASGGWRAPAAHPYSLPWEPAASPDLITSDFAGEAVPLFGTTSDKRFSGTGRLLLSAGAGAAAAVALEPNIDSAQNGVDGPLGGLGASPAGGAAIASAAKLRLGGRNRRWSGA